MDGAVLVMFEEEAFMFFPPTATEQVEIRFRRATMTERDRRLQEIRERYEASTPGEWCVILKGNSIRSHAVTSIKFVKPVCSGISPKRHDAAFIAHAHQDIPWLLAEIERLEAELEVANYHAGLAL